jgi:hypothetical protein
MFHFTDYVAAIERSNFDESKHVLGHDGDFATSESSKVR